MRNDGGQAFATPSIIMKGEDGRDMCLSGSPGMSYRQWLMGTVGNPPKDYPWPEEPDLGPSPTMDEFMTDGNYDSDAFGKALDDRRELCKVHKRRRCLERAMEWRKKLADRIIAEDENA